MRFHGRTALGVRRIAATLLAAVGAAACSNTGGPRPSPLPAAIPVTDPAAIARARADSVRHPYTEADVRFMSRMIGHHAQAIVMAKLAPTHGASISIRNLAERIINGQEDEIATMQRWLADRLKPVPEGRPAEMKMMMNGAAHEMLMPGMLTEQQIKQLDQARGPAFDKLFLTFMIQHHRGAVLMVKELFDSYGAGQDELVFKFAGDVGVDQSTEIERMEKMLVSLP
jgi:uncharacterized protein (DUF305 family)